MKKSLFVVFFLVMYMAGFSASWIGITSSVEKPAKVNLVSSSIERSVVHFSMEGFGTREVQTPEGTAYMIYVKDATPILAKDAPDLPKLTATLVIPDLAGMDIRVVSSTYKDFENILVAPSKGNLMRDIDPSQVPFRFGKVYSTDKFWPGNLTDTREPFIIRELRGQTLIVYPFQYNPVTRTLRVYYDITVELYKVNDHGLNPLVRKDKDVRISSEFSSVYSHSFLNFGNLTYTPLAEYGNMLVISYGAFMDAMQPYVSWKRSIGFPTEMVDVATIGTTAAAIKTYIANYYNTNGLTFVLLVGDGPQIPTNQGSGLGGPSDNAYGYIVGNDHYADAFVGRFSAETVAQVQTQVQRTIDYEKTPQYLTDDWFSTVIGIASDQGPGDDNEYDYQHVRNLQTQCLAYTYTWNPELFDGSQGGNDAPGNPTPQQVATEVNAGAGLILYTGHGSQTSWGTSGFSNNNVNQLVNMGKLPFIWSVACVNGDFVSGTCFAEAWLRATQSNQPTGAVAFLGSTINQSWNSPMDGEDEMVAILVESYPTNIKHTFAGLSINGCMKMIDSYGMDGSNMADTWTVFGDPSLLVRTDTPGTLTVTHDATLFVGATSMTVGCDVNGARATATLNDSILATGLIQNNTITLTFGPLPSPNDSVHLVVTAFNYLPDISDIPIITPSGPYISYISNTVSDPGGNNNQLVDYDEDFFLTVVLKNLGVAATSNLNVTLRCSDPYITRIDTTEFYGAISPNQTKSVPDAFKFHVSSQVPDGHAIQFEVISVDGSSTWTNVFAVTAHAPKLVLAQYVLDDSQGNNNGRLDPGETATLNVYAGNDGSSTATNVTGELVSINPFVLVTPAQQSYGTLTGGQSVSKSFTVVVDPLAPQGQNAPFLFELNADKGITGVGNFSLVIGKIPVLLVDYDLNNNSATAMQDAISSLGLTSVYKTTVPDTLDQYTSIFVCLGVYPDNTVLSNTDGQSLADYLNTGGRLYMEGGDTWKFDPPTPVHPMFNINGTDDGMGDLGNITGVTGTFTAGMSFNYSGDNSYIDHIAPLSAAFTVLNNVTPAYATAVANDAGTYKTIGASHEFGGLDDATYPSTRQHLMLEYLNFFGIQPPPLMANFIGYPTQVVPGGSVAFTDFSSGAISSWSWSFPGGTPSSSTDKNPVVIYTQTGIYDAKLIVGDGVIYDTLLRSNYITVDFPTGIGPVSGLSCSVQPNPSKGMVRLVISGSREEQASVRIVNTLGNVVYESGNIAVDRGVVKEINLSAMPDGIYFLLLKGDSGSLTKKIILQK